MAYVGAQGGYHELFSDDEGPPQPGFGHGSGLGGPGIEDETHIVDPHNTSPQNPDLDNFFRKIYTYHQKHGFMCMLIQNVCEVLQLVFLIVFITFLSSCVDYAILFRDKPIDGRNATEHVKVKLKDGIIPPGQCISGLSGTIRFALVIACFFLLYKIFVAMREICSYLDIKRFYNNVLKISPTELDNMTWHNVQQRLLDAQRQNEHPIAVHKQELNELDVYHRILRQDNYLVALVNKNILPLKFYVPFVGDVAFFSSGLRTNMNILLFWGPWSPFKNNWELREDYKRRDKAGALAEELGKGLLYLGLANLVFMPFVLVYDFLNNVFNYADILKTEPGLLGSRTWSGYARVYLRHFNELEHELNSRLCMGYRAATQYMNAFTTHLTVIVAKNVVFFAGSLWLVLVALTIWDEDFLAVEHIVTALAAFSMILAACRSAIPDEHMVWCPGQLMQTILQHIHYMPDHWRDMAHTTCVRDEFSNLFTYKFTHLLTEVLSAVVTPVLLLGAFRSRRWEIVNFFIENTISIEGVGDVCSFAQMDLERHGDRRWIKAAEPPAHDEGVDQPPLPDPPFDKQAEMGKIELSLAHFHLTNPHWNPESQTGQKFLRDLTSQIEASRLGHLSSQMFPNQQLYDCTSTMAPMPEPVSRSQLMSQSIHSFTSLNPMLSHLRQNTAATEEGDGFLMGRGLTSVQGPLTSVMSSGSRVRSLENSFIVQGSITGSLPCADHLPSVQAVPSVELSALQMSLSAILLYGRHPTACQVNSPGYGTHGTPRRAQPRPMSSGLANIQESRLETTPLLMRHSSGPPRGSGPPDDPRDLR